MKRLLLALLILWPTLALAQTPTPVLQKFPGWKLCEDGRIGSDCVSVGPMPSLAGPLSCPLQADSTPFDGCVTAPTPVPTSAPVATPTPQAPGGSSGNLQTNNGSGGFGAYAGATCPTPGFAISSTASGAWTCATPVAPTPQPTATPGAGSGDITDVWSCTSGNCDALTAAAGDSFDTGSADSSKPTTRSTTLPGTCAEGQHHQDTDSLGGETYICTAANTWVRLTGETAALTAGRVPYVSTGGLLSDEAALTYDASNNRLALSGATTADDNSTNMFSLSGTLPSTPSTAVNAMQFTITSAGSASQGQRGLSVSLAAGYTGNASAVALLTSVNVAGTGGTLGIGADGLSTANKGVSASSTGGTTGLNIGMEMMAQNSTAVNIGGLSEAADNAAGTNIGTLGSAANSTEATDLKNVGGYFTLDNTLITGANISVALLAQGDGTDDIFRGYDDTTLMFRMEDTGEFTSAGVDSIGWSKQAATNQACNTTCTSACVVGFDLVAGLLACSDANADQCVCAGSS